MSLSADAKTFLREFKALTKFAEAISEAGDVELVAKQAESRRDEAEKQREAANSEMENMKTKLAEARKRLHDLEEATATTIEEAERKAKVILETAHEEAINIKTKAHSANEKELHDTKQQLAELRQEIGRISKQREAMLAEQSQVRNALDDLKKRFA